MTPARRDDAGFSLVEMLLAVTMVSILSTIAVPSVVKARDAAAEAATIGTLRLLHGAQSAYAASCGGGYYAPTVARLATPPTNSSAAFIGKEFNANTLTRQGYRVTFTAGAVSTLAPASCNGLAARRGVGTFFIGADPVTNSGARFFGTNQVGIIYQSKQRVRAFYAGTPQNPAVPLR